MKHNFRDPTGTNVIYMLLVGLNILFHRLDSEFLQIIVILFAIPFVYQGVDRMPLISLVFIPLFFLLLALASRLKITLVLPASY